MRRIVTVQLCGWSCYCYWSNKGSCGQSAQLWIWKQVVRIVTALLYIVNITFQITMTFLKCPVSLSNKNAVSIPYFKYACYKASPSNAASVITAKWRSETPHYVSFSSVVTLPPQNQTSASHWSSTPSRRTPSFAPIQKKTVPSLYTDITNLGNIAVDKATGNVFLVPQYS